MQRKSDSLGLSLCVRDSPFRDSNVSSLPSAPTMVDMFKCLAKILNLEVDKSVSTNCEKLSDFWHTRCRTTDSLGRLPLHTLCEKCPESFGHDAVELSVIVSLLEMNTRAISHKDAKGNLPIHVALDRENAPTVLIQQLLHLDPKMASLKNGEGTIPLFIACRRRNINSNIVNLIVQAYPEAASKIEYGCMALHQLVYKGQCNVEALAELIRANPLAASTPNKHGNLPLHLLCAGTPNLEGIRILLQAFPEGISVRNKSGESPITKALQKSVGRFSDSGMEPEFTRLVLRAAPRHLLKEEELNTLRDVNWLARKSAVFASIKCGKEMMNDILPTLYVRIPGLWREIVSML